MVLISSLVSVPLLGWNCLQTSDILPPSLQFLRTLPTFTTSTTTANALFTFGSRPVTPTMIAYEVAMGLCLTVPLCFPVGQLILRLNCTNAFSFLRSILRRDVWNAWTAIVVADVVLELVLPSAKCLPTPGMFPLSSSMTTTTTTPMTMVLSWLHWMCVDGWSWLQTMWGHECYIQLPSDVLTPVALGCVLTLRMAFVMVGLSLGQGLAPIAITGGIATGKSTILNMLQETSTTTTTDSQNEDQDKNKNETNNNNNNKDESATTTPSSDSSHPPSNEATNDNDNDDDDKPEAESYTFYVIDCDKIGHEILLPPQELSSKEKGYSVQPHESVYANVCRAFDQYDIFVDNDNNKEKEDGASSSSMVPPLIDRTKLGAVIFGDTAHRRTLNRLTHARIFWILFQRCCYGCWWSGADFTVAEVPLLFESKSWFLQHLFCLSVMVTVPDSTVQWNRLRHRHADWSEEDCRNRIQAQLSLAEKERRATLVLVNGDDRDQVRHELEHMVDQEWGHRLYGVGVSAAHILLLVTITLTGGMTYLLWNKPPLPAA